MSNSAETTTVVAEPIPECPHCQKPMPLCICDSVTPIKSRLGLLILQHPQEQDRALGTARLLAKHFADATVRVGLSWPSLSKALGQPVENASHWAVLYLGSARPATFASEHEVVALDRGGMPAANQDAMLRGHGVALEDVGNGVVNGFVQFDPLREILRLTGGGLDHFAQATALQPSQLPELLFADLFNRSALQLLGPGLVDDVGDFIFGEPATEALLLFGHGGIPLL